MAFGFTLLVMAFTIGPISGCHINPAVTLGMVLTGKTKGNDAVWYIAGQVVGGILAGLVVFLIANGLTGFDAHNNFAANGYGVHSPNGYDLAAVALAEVVLTALLVLVVVGTTRSDAVPGFGPIAAGLTLALIHLVSIPVSNTSVNPARSLAAAHLRRERRPRPALGLLRVPAHRGRAGGAGLPVHPRRGAARGLNASPSGQR